mgnify:CR=1 FL=1
MSAIGFLRKFLNDVCNSDLNSLVEISGSLVPSVLTTAFSISFIIGSLT